MFFIPQKVKPFLLFFMLVACFTGRGQSGDVEKKITSVFDFTEIDELPEFPGGQNALTKFIANNFVIPAKDVKERNEGKIFVSFVINKSGKTTDVKVIRGINKRLDNEAIRVIAECPLWKPGFIDGKKVKVRFNIPIAIKIPEVANKQ